ncbi:MAG: GGDEF domain-containing protein [Lachnospiraceae bacterium]|nr:GGDEF domain-containing protein [Lachnospiraceae bacterium]
MNIIPYNRRQAFDPYVIKRIYLVNTVLLLCHISFAIFFKLNNIDLLYYFSWLSISTYIFTYYVLYKNWAYAYIIILYIEIYLFVLLSLLCFGWDYGFQLYCFSFTVAVFFCDYYVNRNYKIRKKTVGILALLVVTFYAMKIWTNTHEPFYPSLPKEMANTFYLSNAFITFAFIMGYLLIYSNTVFHLEKALLDTANRDPLTGLRNRRRMQELLHSASDEFSKTPHQMCIAMIDIDHFKQINDTYGHDAGDEVLLAVADIFLRKHAENNSFHACRWGGEEFLIFYRKYQKEQSEVCQEFESIRQEIENKSVIYQNNEIHFTVTIGLSFHSNQLTVTDMIKQADENLYKGKEEGRNRVMI